MGSSAIVTWNNVENASGTGLAAGAGVTAQWNRLIGNVTGMTASTGLIEHNLIANSSGVGLHVGAATVRYNTLTGNAGNTIVVDGGVPPLPRLSRLGRLPPTEGCRGRPMSPTTQLQRRAEMLPPLNTTIWKATPARLIYM